MSVPLATQREFDRWYLLKEHETQLALVRDNVRFKVVPAGRRSGKTERFKRFVVKQAMQNPGMPYFAGAPTRDQAKRIFWKDLKALSLSTTHIKKPYETDLIIELNNGATLSIIGFDKPERFEGQFWAGGGIDEFGDLKEDAWEAHIAPALDTFNPTMPDYKPWCWLFGVPEGLNHYYERFCYAMSANDPEWKAYSWPSSAILPEETIQAAKRRMSARQYRQEYEASFENAGGRIYDDYGFDNHCKETIQPHETLMWAHDQNFTPLSSCIAVRRNDNIYILDEIVLTSAVSKQSALEFVEKFKNHKNKTVYIYGDPAGRAGEKHGHASDYTDIEAILRSNGWIFSRRVKLSAPSIKDRQNSVRAKVKSADGYISMFVNPSTAPWSDKGMATVQLKEGSAFQEDQSNKYQHITTAIGYMIDYEFPINKPVINTPINFMM